MRYMIYNHLTFNVDVHKEIDSSGKISYYVVGLNIIPMSIASKEDKEPNCSKSAEEYQHNFKALNVYLDDELESMEINFTYDVIVKESDIKYSSRWDNYIKLTNPEIHNMAFFNSFAIICILSFVVILVICRALKRDIAYINQSAMSDDVIDTSSWKQLSNEVFRKPRYSFILSAMVGTGIQLLGMIVIMLIMGFTGFLKPENRGYFLSFSILNYIFLGIVSGYNSSRLYKMFNGNYFLLNSLVTSVLFPLFAFVIFITINVFLALEESSAAVT